MADIVFDDFRVFGHPPLSCHDRNIYSGDFDQWSGTTFPESHATAPIDADCLDNDIELLYTGLHKCVDQVVAAISVRTPPPRLDRIREQNRKVIDKLRTLESVISGDAEAVVFDSGSPAYASASASASASDTDRVRSGRGKRRRVSLPTNNIPSVSPISQTRNVTLPTKHTHEGSHAHSGLDPEATTSRSSPRAPEVRVPGLYLVGSKETLSWPRSCCRLGPKKPERAWPSLRPNWEHPSAKTHCRASHR
ncbi:hypothetical protein VTK56DRAFT_1153 [Thermocarpiscus australiensis]